MKVRLSDLCDVGIGRTPPRKQSWWFSRYCGNKWVSIKDMGLSNKYLSITSEYLTDDAVEKFNVPKIERGTIILSFKLTIGRIAIVSEDMYSNEAIAQLPIKQSAANLADRDYLYYKLKYYDYDKLGSTSSIATAINSKMLANMEIDLPDLATQKKIADTLSAFDDKIELNRQMNETLEEMGRVLFRHYFIDNPEAKNWPMVKVGDLIEPKRGKSLISRDMKGGGVPVVGGGLSAAGMHNVANTMAPVVTISASGANAGYVSLWGAPVWSSDSSYIDSTVTPYIYYWYFFLKSKQKEIFDMQTGTGQPHIYPSHIGLLDINNAPEKMILKFNNTVEPLLFKLFTNNNEMLSLNSTRDMLAEKLVK